MFTEDYRIHIPTNDGYWVDEKFQILAEVVKDYSPTLELRWIPPNMRTDPEDRKNPYCIYDLVAQAPVMFAGELDTPEDILKRLFLSDNTKHNVLEEIEAQNAAVKALQMKQWLNSLEEAGEMAKFMIASPLNYLKMKDEDGKLIKLDESRRRVDQYERSGHKTESQAPLRG